MKDRRVEGRLPHKGPQADRQHAAMDQWAAVEHPDNIPFMLQRLTVTQSELNFSGRVGACFPLFLSRSNLTSSLSPLAPTLVLSRPQLPLGGEPSLAVSTANQHLLLRFVLCG